MNKLQLKILGGVFIVAVIGVILWLSSRPTKDSCEYSESIEANDRFFAPYLSDSTEVQWYPNHYNCTKPQKGDLVWYVLGNPPQNYFRIIVAAEGDEVQLVPDRDSRGWNLLVNGQMLMANDMPYFFGVPKKQTTLAIYLKNGIKTLGPKEIIMFSSNPPGFNDSGIFGMYNIDSMKGKIVLPKEKNKMFSEYVARMYSEEVAKAYFENPPKDLNKTPEPPPAVGLVKPKPQTDSATTKSETDEDLIFNDKEEKPLAKPAKAQKPNKAKLAPNKKVDVKKKPTAKGKTSTKTAPKANKNKK